MNDITSGALFTATDRHGGTIFMTTDEARLHIEAFVARSLDDGFTVPSLLASLDAKFVARVRAATEHKEELAGIGKWYAMCLSALARVALARELDPVR